MAGTTIVNAAGQEIRLKGLFLSNNTWGNWVWPISDELQKAGRYPLIPPTEQDAWVLTDAGMSPDVFKLIEKYITGRSMVYRIHSIGYFGEGGPTARVEAVIDTNQGAPRILYFRDMTDLDTPRAFDPPR